MTCVVILLKNSIDIVFYLELGELGRFAPYQAIYLIRIISDCIIIGPWLCITTTSKASVVNYPLYNESEVIRGNLEIDLRWRFHVSD